MSTTSAKALQELAATDEQLRTAEQSYDHALAVGTDAEVAEAEAALERLRRTRMRLQRQNVVLTSKEGAEREACDQRLREEADADVHRAKREMDKAFAEFLPDFRAHVAETLDIARRHLEAPLNKLVAAKSTADQLHGRIAPYYAPAQTWVVGYMIDDRMLNFLAKLNLPTELLEQHVQELNALTLLEGVSRELEAQPLPPAA